jgi:hypothetical protein
LLDSIRRRATSVVVGDLDGNMERLKALHAQRKRAVAEVDRLDGEIRSVALSIAEEVAADIEAAASRTAAPRKANGTGHVAPAHLPVALAQVKPPAAVSTEGRLAPRKLELLGLLRAHPDGTTEWFARKMYGNSSRHARVNVSSYFSDLKSENYVEAGASSGTFVLTAKGLSVTEPRESIST